MRKVAILALIFIFLSTSVFAAEPGGWSFWMYIGETLAGFGCGLGAAAITSNALANSSTSANVYASMGAIGIGSAGGVILVGELFGAKSENPGLTYGLTAGTSIAFPLIIAASTGLANDTVSGDSGDFGGALGGAIANGMVAFGVILADPHIAAVTYNIVKKPEMPSKTSDLGFELKPHSAYLTDSGGDLVPLYGLTVSF